MIKEKDFDFRVYYLHHNMLQKKNKSLCVVNVGVTVSKEPRSASEEAYACWMASTTLWNNCDLDRGLPRIPQWKLTKISSVFLNDQICKTCCDKAQRWHRATRPATLSRSPVGDVRNCWAGGSPLSSPATSSSIACVPTELINPPGRFYGQQKKVVFRDRHCSSATSSISKAQHWRTRSRTHGRKWGTSPSICKSLGVSLKLFASVVLRQ